MRGLDRFKNLSGGTIGGTLVFIVFLIVTYQIIEGPLWVRVGHHLLIDFVLFLRLWP